MYTAHTGLKRPVFKRFWRWALFIPQRSSWGLPLFLVLILIIPIISCGAEQPQDDNFSVTPDIPSKYTKEDLSARLSESDVVLLGKIDACWVCQFEPDPHVLYTEVLIGEVSQDEAAKGDIPLGAIATKLLPSGGVPIYKSHDEEICFLKKAVSSRFQTDRYIVIDVWEKTPAHLKLLQLGKEGEL